MIKIHHFDTVSGAYLNSSEAPIDPLADTPMVPRNATLAKPPAVNPNEVAVWDGSNWILKADHRGEEYWLPDGSHALIMDIGIEPPKDALKNAPPESHAVQRQTALAMVDQVHASYLEKLTGNATHAERDTWARKLMAARGVLSGSPHASDVLALTKGAAERGVSIEEFAGNIELKDAAFAALIDQADALRDKARTAVIAATDETVTLSKVEGQIIEVFKLLAEEVAVAALAFSAANNG